MMVPTGRSSASLLARCRNGALAFALMLLPAPASAQEQTPPAAAAPTTAPTSAPATAAPSAPEQAVDAVPAGEPAIAAVNLPRDLSPWGMIASADLVVKAVMAGLALASVITWTVWVAKTIEIALLKRRAAAALRRLAEAHTLADAAQGIDPAEAVGRLLNAAESEQRMSADAVDKNGIKERVASRLERIEAGFARRVSRGTGVLATIGATAPFVGLFGTVWGIMNSFIGISKSQTTNLAVVAPGIAEALLATAFGLAAAIPAVVIYNMFARQIGGYRAQLGDASAAVLRLVSRDLDRRADAAAQPPARKPAVVTAAE